MFRCHQSTHYYLTPTVGPIIFLLIKLRKLILILILFFQGAIDSIPDVPFVLIHQSAYFVAFIITRDQSMITLQLVAVSYCPKV